MPSIVELTPYKKYYFSIKTYRIHLNFKDSDKNFFLCASYRKKTGPWNWRHGWLRQTLAFVLPRQAFSLPRRAFSQVQFLFCFSLNISDSCFNKNSFASFFINSFTLTIKWGFALPCLPPMHFLRIITAGAAG